MGLSEFKNGKKEKLKKSEYAMNGAFGECLWKSLLRPAFVAPERLEMARGNVECVLLKEHGTGQFRAAP
jgi:hypothetical protein